MTGPGAPVRRIRPCLVALAAALGAAPAAAQEGLVRGRVLDAVSGLPIANADVEVLGRGLRTFTDAAGAFQFRRVPPGPQVLRARQIGYRLALDSVLVDPAPAPRELRLQPAALALDELVAQGRAECRRGGLLAEGNGALPELYAQLRSNAERARAVLEAFPFTVEWERRTETRPEKGSARTERRTELLDSRQMALAYVPEAVFVQRGTRFALPVLFLDALASRAFQERHCFHYAGVTVLGEARYHRIDFAPRLDLNAIDWAGSLYLDVGTVALRRLEFRLTGLARDRNPVRLEGTSTYHEIFPSLSLPDSTESRWWRSSLALGGVGASGEQLDGTQQYVLTGLSFFGELPAGPFAPPRRGRAAAAAP